MDLFILNNIMVNIDDVFLSLNIFVCFLPSLCLLKPFLNELRGDILIVDVVFLAGIHNCTATVQTLKMSSSGS